MPRMRSNGGCVAVLAFLLASGGLPDGGLHQPADHEKEVLSACVAASSLREAKAAGKPVAFDDRVGFTAVVIDGRYPQPHMKDKRGRVLCLFDRRTRTPFVSDADGLLGERKP